MAQVGVQQPTNLMEMFSSPSPMMWDIANQQVNDQTLGNLINRQQAQQSMDFAQQEQPYKVQGLDLANQTSAAHLPGIQATSTMLQNKANIDTGTLDAQKQSKLAELAKNVSDSDLTQAENAVKTALVHPSAQVREQAGQMWNQLSAIKEMRMQQELESQRAYGLVGAQGEQARLTQQQAIDAGKFVKKGNMALETQIMIEGDPIKRDALIRGALQQAMQTGDTDTAQKYQQFLMANKPAYDAAMKTKAVPTGAQLNIPGMSGQPGIETPTASIPQIGQQQTPQEAPDKLQLTPAAISGAFGSYEPNKYQYRRDPVTGKLQRKPL